MSSNSFTNVNKKFLDKIEKNKQLAENRKQEIYAVIPRIAQIEEEIMMSSYKMFVSVCAGEEPERAADKFGKTVEQLKAERDKLLCENGFETNYDTRTFECDKCKDTGYVSGKLCSCYKNELIKELYRESGMGTLLKKQTFDKFDLSLYRNTKNGDELSPYENMAINFKLCKDFVKNFDKRHDNLLLYGAPGLGKTFLSSAIANSLIKKGKTVLYKSAGQVFNDIEKLKFGKTIDAGAETLVDMLDSVDLLIIDDLGTEFYTTLSASELFRIINTRILNEKSTIISTNLSLQDIKKTYSERVLSRIVGSYTHLKFYGDDIRLGLGR